MKKYIHGSVASLILLFGIGITYAQGNISFGIKGGLSIPNLRAGESENEWNKNYTSRRGPYFGIVAEIPVTSCFYLQGEINYAAQGGKRSGIQPITIPAEYQDVFQQFFKTDKDYIFADLRSVSNINYLQIPLMLKFRYPVAAQGRLSLFVEAGPFIGFLLSAKQHVYSENLRVYLDAEGKEEIPPSLVRPVFGSGIDTVINAKNDLHKFNIGFQGGVGISFRINKRWDVFAEGGGNYGLKPIQKGADHGKNNIGAATILAGVGFTLGRTHEQETGQ